MGRAGEKFLLQAFFYLPPLIEGAYYFSLVHLDRDAPDGLKKICDFSTKYFISIQRYINFYNEAKITFTLFSVIDLFEIEGAILLKTLIGCFGFLLFPLPQAEEENFFADTKELHLITMASSFLHPVFGRIEQVISVMGSLYGFYKIKNISEEVFLKSENKREGLLRVSKCTILSFPHKMKGGKCGICSNKFEPHEKVMRYCKGRHFFHNKQECNLLKWIGKPCPLCREPLLKSTLYWRRYTYRGNKLIDSFYYVKHEKSLPEFLEPIFEKIETIYSVAQAMFVCFPPLYPVLLAFRVVDYFSLTFSSFYKGCHIKNYLSEKKDGFSVIKKVSTSCAVVLFLRIAQLYFAPHIDLNRLAKRVSNLHGSNWKVAMQWKRFSSHMILQWILTLRLLLNSIDLSLGRKLNWTKIGAQMTTVFSLWATRFIGCRVKSPAGKKSFFYLIVPPFEKFIR